MSKWWRLLSAPLIAVVVALAMATPASAYCAPVRGDTAFITDNYLTHAAQSGIRFKTVKGNLVAPTDLYVAGGDPSFVYLELTGPNGARARVGYRIDGDGSYHRYYYATRSDGSVLLNYVETNSYARTYVDTATLRIDLVENELGGTTEVRLWHTTTGYLRQPFAAVWEGWHAGFSQWVFRTRNTGSQFFGHVSTTAKWGVENATYTSNVGSGQQWFGLVKNHFNAWARTYIVGGNAAYSYDEGC